jgi:solute carrier family 25 oxoglutarate transporter 11
MTAVMPIDTVKVRQQLMAEGKAAGGGKATFTGVVKNIVAVEGVTGLYSGLSAAWARMLVYGSARIGLFRVLSDELKSRQQGGTCPQRQPYTTYQHCIILYLLF